MTPTHQPGKLLFAFRVSARRLALLSVFALPGPLPAATIYGHVVDHTGAAVDAYVFVFDNSKHPRSAEPLPGHGTVADGNGRYSFNLAAGFYDVCVFQAGFSASCRKVFLQKEDSVLQQDFKMKLDPLTAKELGDRFPSR